MSARPDRKRAGGSPRRPPTPASAPRARGLAARWPLALAGVFVLALAWRLAYLHRLAGTPLWGSLAADAGTYWRWAGELRAHGPLGRHAFFLGPLYPYVLALVRALAGDSVGRVLVVQAAWGAAAAALLADAARRLTRPALGLAVGLWVATSEMAVFFDGLVLGESLLFALGALLLWAVVVAGRPLRPAWALLLGALLGALAQGRALEAVLLVPGAALAWAGGGERPARMRAVALVLAAFALVSLPAALRNRAVSGEWIPFTYNAGYNLYVGNNPDATGGFVSITGTYDIAPADDPGAAEGGAEADGRDYLARGAGARLGPSASSAHWALAAGRWARAHPARAAQLAARKLAMLWNWRETPQIENADEFRALAGPLGLPWLGRFALVGLLCFAGFVPAWRAGAPGRFLLGGLVLLTLAHAPFFVTDRYRLQLVPAAVLVAALGADALARAWRARGPWIPVVPMLAAGALVLALPTPHVGRARYAWGLASDLGARWLEHGRSDEAVRWLERAVRMDEHGDVRWQAAAGESLQRGGLYADYGRALADLGRTREAVAACERAVSLAPGSRAMRERLASAYAASGDVARAGALYAALGTPGGEADALLRAGRAAAQGGDLARAEQGFRAATERAPRSGAAWGALVRIRAQRGDVAGARASLERARAAGWTGTAFGVHEALVLALEGDVVRARALLGAQPQAAVDGDPELADVARVIRQTSAPGASPPLAPRRPAR